MPSSPSFHLTRSKWLLLAASSVLAVNAASAQLLINVDFNGGQYNSTPGASQTGPGVTGTGGDFWNGVSDANAPSNGTVPVYDSNYDGSQDAVGQLTYHTSGGYALNPQFANAFSASYFGDYPSTNGQYGPLMSDYFADSGAGSTITLTGLPKNAAFSLYVYSEANNNTDANNLRPVLFSATGASSTVTLNPDNSAGHFVQASNGPANGAQSNYGVLDPVSDAAGTLTITFTAQNGEGDLDGFQLQELPMADVPEPSTVGIVALSAAGAAAAGWKRRRAC